MTATDSTDPTPQTSTQTESITITPRPVVVTTAKLHQAVVTKAFSESLAAEGGVSPYTWTTSSGALPPGLTLGANGSIQGVPTTAGDFSFTVEATDSYDPADAATRALTLSVVSK